MSNNRNSYMNQNVAAMNQNVSAMNQNLSAMNQNLPGNQRNMNMRGGYVGQGARQGQRTVQNDCGCSGNAGYSRTADIPTGDRASLLAYIDQVSFAAYEAALYLDTHPDCQSGLQYFREHNEKRNLARKEYAKLYGPLTLAQANESCDAYWQWINQPWPWEGGNC